MLFLYSSICKSCRYDLPGSLGLQKNKWKSKKLLGPGTKSFLPTIFGTFSYLYIRERKKDMKGLFTLSEPAYFLTPMVSDLFVLADCFKIFCTNPFMDLLYTQCQIFFTIFLYNYITFYWLYNYIML